MNTPSTMRQHHDQHLTQKRHMPAQSIEDYRKLYQREHRKRIALEAKCQRINKAMIVGLAPRLTLLAIAQILTPTRDKQPLYLTGEKIT